MTTKSPSQQKQKTLITLRKAPEEAPLVSIEPTPAPELPGEVAFELPAAPIPEFSGLLGQLVERLPEPIQKAIRAIAPLAEPAAAVSIATALPVAQATASAGQLLFVGYIPRRKRRPWGEVVDESGLPVQGALVQLADLEKKRVVAQQVTDREGRFGFLIAQPGRFGLKVSHPHYEALFSPAFAVSDPRQPVADQRVTLKALAALPQLGFSQQIRRLLDRLTVLHYPILLLGFFINGLNVLVYGRTDFFPLVLLVLYLGLIVGSLLTRRLPRPYGEVRDAEAKTLVSLALVRAIAHLEGRTQVAATAVTDQSGRFRIILKPGQYEFVTTKAGYERAAFPQTLGKGRLPAITIQLSRGAVAGRMGG